MATTDASKYFLDLVGDNKKKIVMLAQLSKKPGFHPDDPKHKLYFEGLDSVLSYLEQDFAMTPEVKQASQIDKILEVVCVDTRYRFPQIYVERSSKLLERFVAENWGGLAEIKDESEEEIPLDTTAGARKSSKAPRSPVKFTAKIGSTIIQPPADHPIWGRDGIMHGLALRRSANGSLSKVLNPAFAHEKRDFRVHGDNGLEVGQWFPSRLAALFAGAHGHSQAGISGNDVDGAWSVVVSGMYEDLDTDSGDTVLYSGSGSHDNEDPKAPADSTNGTRALQVSLRSRNVVRLLRSSAASLAYAPVEGVRYDGLYRVVATDTPRNANGGLYERFKLVREPRQIPLAKCKERPSRQELKDYNRINAGYSGYGMK